MENPDLRALRGKTVVLGVCGGIAVYKAVEVMRLLVHAGAEVFVVMTDLAKKDSWHDIWEDDWSRE